MTTAHHQPSIDALNADYLHSAFVVDNEGNEIRITRDMILACCNKLASNEAKKPQKPDNN